MYEAVSFSLFCALYASFFFLSAQHLHHKTLLTFSPSLQVVFHSMKLSSIFALTICPPNPFSHFFLLSFCISLLLSVSSLCIVSIAPILFSSIKLCGIFALTTFLHTYFIFVFLAPLSSNICFASFFNIFINIFFLFFQFRFLAFLLMSIFNLFFCFFLQVFLDILVGCFLPLLSFNNLFFSFANVFIHISFLCLCTSRLLIAFFFVLFH